MIMWRTPGDAARDAGRRPERRARGCDPRPRDLLRRHLRGGRHATTARSAPTSSPPRACTTASAASCPRSPRATTSSSSTPSSTTRCASAGATLDDVDPVAVTQGPGLVGALLVGVATAKGLAAARRLPLRRSTTCRATSRRTSSAPDPIEPPFLCLIASGGHTLLVRVEDHRGYTVLGRTLDDAAGEAFDKGARLLGLGYPGGPALSRLGAEGDPRRSPSRPPRASPAWTSPSPG